MKNAIRTWVLTMRNSMSPAQLKENSALIKEKLFSMSEYQKAKTVFFYVSTGSEVDTHGMIKEAAKSKKVAVPVSERSSKNMHASLLQDFSELEKGNYGILEPKKEFFRPADKEAIDLFIIPGTAFDMNGSRLGYGHGYFDRFLKDIVKPKIALAFEMQIVDLIPAEEKDISVDFIVTEKRITDCRS